MAFSDHLNATLQENLITLLAYDRDHGPLIARTLNADLFERQYRDIAEVCIAFWKRRHEPPSVHIRDELERVGKWDRHEKLYERALAAMEELNDRVNTGYVLEQLARFERMQTFKSAILKSTEKLTGPGETTIEEVEKLWADVLRERKVTHDAGMRLTDIDRGVEYMDKHSSDFITGIAALDKRFIVPARKEVMTFLAPTGRGKTWFLTQIGKAAIMRRKKVIHLSYEMPEEQVVARYWQSIFNVSVRWEDHLQTHSTILEKLEGGGLKGLTLEHIPPEFAFDSEDIRLELYHHLEVTGWARNLYVKSFPPNSHRMDDVRAYLDNLEAVEGFIPDMILFDYMGISKTDSKNHRIDLGRNMVDFRAICVERNIAGVTPMQGNRGSLKIKQVDTDNMSEDISVAFTADCVITQSQTDAERSLGLARLYVSKNRSAADKFSVLITQNYSNGQYCLDSVPLPRSYNKMLKDVVGEDEDLENDERVAGDGDE